MAPPYDAVYLDSSFPCPCAEAAKKGAPALTIQQALVLLASILPLKQLDPLEAIQRVRFVQKQNYAAYASHRKRTIRRLNGL